jgi:hypothetical protein
MMNVISFVSGLLKWKVIAATSIGAVLVGGMGIALASTSARHVLAQDLTNMGHTMASSAQMPGNKGHGMANMRGQAQHNSASTCPGDPEAQQVAMNFSLSTDKNGSAIQVICALHDGNFNGTVNGKSVTSNHPFGYGEIDQLLTYAQSLAAKSGSKLTDSDVQQYVATALSTCNTMSIGPCVNGNDGESTATPTTHENGNSTSTSPSREHGKPTSTPTPPSNK